ncbi:hypothetical protein Tco_0593539 [Tanacetum coccineum]
MLTELELTLEQTQQGVSYEVSNIRVISFTMKMEILLEPTSNKLMVEPITDEAANEEHVPTHSNDPLLSGEDRLKLMELWSRSLKEGISQELQGLKVKKVEVTLVDEAQGRNDDNLMFDTRVLYEQEVEVEKVVSAAEVTTVREEEEACKTKSKEDANIIEWDIFQAMIDAYYELAARLHAQEQEYVTRAEESSSKRAGTKLEQERIKKQKMDDDQQEAKIKKHMEIVFDKEEIAVDAIPLATKPPVIVDWKIIKEGKMGYFQIIRADGSSRSATQEALKECYEVDLKVRFELDVEKVNMGEIYKDTM